MGIIKILLVEDNEGDIILTTEALENAKIQLKLSVVKDGKEAIDFISKKGKYSNEDTPDILLLDLNLPKKNGLEVLHFMKSNEELKQIPIIILTTSSSAKDINDCYRGFANCYITKPLEIGDFLSVITTIENFWISLVKLPQNK